jgi:hypothetical protein
MPKPVGEAMQPIHGFSVSMSNASDAFFSPQASREVFWGIIGPLRGPILNPETMGTKLSDQQDYPGRIRSIYADQFKPCNSKSRENQK